MPKNNKLEPVKLPMEIKFGKSPKTKFKNNLESIKVELMDEPSVEQLKTVDELLNYLPQFADATWATEYNSNDNLSDNDKDRIIRDVFLGKTLPTALETINLTFRISGISLQEVTHIIRYRNASFSADCSGDKWWSDKDALVPNSIENSTLNGISPNDEGYYSKDNFYARYMDIVNQAKQLYCDMIDSKKISIMDARYILPRCLDTFYYMRLSLKDALHFIKQRIDKQIQPETDNIIAYRMYICILKQFYPYANGIVNIHEPSWFYVKTARTGKATNLYFPDSDSDMFEWNEQDFIYQCRRDEMNGTDEDATNKFNEILALTEKTIDSIERGDFIEQ